MPGDEFFLLQRALAGRYSVLAEIGRGGMGIVFAARDIALDRPVAIKLLPPALAAGEDAHRRFLREARTAASLSHPHIVPIHAVEETDGLVYFVMALVDGESVGQRVRREGPLPVRDAMRVLQEVAWALAHAHARGVVHRDIKPDNILIERESGRALVTDFGIAHATGRDTPVDGVALGTPAYMSPEQGRGEEPDARSDVYALGVTAWVLIAGRPPFPGPDAMAFLLQHASEPAPSLHSARAGLPTALVEAIDRCLAKSPEDRWPSAEALAVALGTERSRTSVVPAPVRAFLQEWDRVGAEATTAGTAAVVSATLSAVLASPLLVSGGDWTKSFDREISSALFLLIAVLTGTLAASRLVALFGRARELRAAGYDHRALTQGQRTTIAERRDESPTSAAPATRTALAAMAAGGVGVAGLGLWGVFHFSDALLVSVLMSATVVGPTVAVRAIMRRIAAGARESGWSRLLRGWPGRALLRLGGFGVKAPSAARLSGGGDPTILAVGAQAREALDALPAGHQKAFAEVPTLIDRLEQEAMALRGATADSRAAARLSEAIAAADLLRLDLMKLGTVTAGAGELTAAIERVQDIGRRIDALVELNRDLAS